MASWFTDDHSHDLGNVRFDERRVRYSPISLPDSSDRPRSIKESTGGWRYILVNAQVVPTFSSGARPYNLVSGDNYVQGTLLSELDMWNSWPEVQNQSIFSFFLEDTSFGKFVRDYYQSSCAVVYYPSNGDPKIIGTGSYIDSIWEGKKEGVVATARHNFSGVSLSQLYVRFFHYNVSQINSHWLCVDEDFLDVPVTNTEIAAGGLDAGILRLLPIPSKYQAQYTKMLPLCVEGRYRDDWATIPAGKYAMFHFAGAEPHISVGHIYPSPGAVLSSEIRIEAGPGASGASVFQQIGDRITTHGISIYRHMDDWGIGRDTQRTIIPFERFTCPGILDNPIVAPYNNPDFQVFSPESLEEDGYEFLRVKPTGREESPNDPLYRVDNHMSNHHIIPMGKLLYLWDYFYTSSELPRDIWDSKSRRKGEQSHYNDHVERTYATARDLMFRLIANPTGEPRENRDKFAWACWNLFKGWNGDYRTDDPESNLEETRPQGFLTKQWEHIYNLNSSIEELWKTSQRFDPREIQKSQQNVIVVLREFYSYLNKFRPSRVGLIHLFYEPEWEVMGNRQGHRLYRVKP